MSCQFVLAKDKYVILLPNTHALEESHLLKSCSICYCIWALNNLDNVSVRLHLLFSSFQIFLPWIFAQFFFTIFFHRVLRCYLTITTILNLWEVVQVCHWSKEHSFIFGSAETFMTSDMNNNSNQSPRIFTESKTIITFAHPPPQWMKNQRWMIPNRTLGIHF